MKVTDRFSAISRKAAELAGSWQAFIAACAVVITWILGGFYFGFLDTVYQLIINSFTTIITFLMVFLIQSAQNRDTSALHLKIDDLLRSIEKANESLIDIENATDEQMNRAREEICTSNDDSFPDAPHPSQHPD